MGQGSMSSASSFPTQQLTHWLQEQLRRKTMALIAKTDVLREYYNSQTGEGEGAQNFMWTASLFVAMALQDPA